MAEAVETLGSLDSPASLDVVVNAAGVLSFAHSHEHTLEDWNRVIGIT